MARTKRPAEATVSPVIADWNRLRDQLARINDKGAEIEGLLARARADHLAAHAALADARIRAFRDDEEAEARIPGLREQIAGLDAEIVEFEAQGKALGIAERGARTDIERLMVAHPEDFVAYAAQFSEAAEQALEHLRAGYEAALEAWSTATHQWDQIGRVTGVGFVPECPLPPLDAVFGVRRPVPSMLAEVADLAHVGPLVTWERTPGGALVTLPADDARNRLLNTDALMSLRRGRPVGIDIAPAVDPADLPVSVDCRGER